MNNTDPFIGTWTPVEWSVTHKASGYVHYPFSGNAEGHIIYTDNGWVSALLMETGRKHIPQDRHRLVAARMHLNPPKDAPSKNSLSMRNSKKTLMNLRTHSVGPAWVMLLSAARSVLKAIRYSITLKTAWFLNG